MRIYNRCIEIEVVPEDWKVACFMQVYKRRAERSEYMNFRGIRTLNIHGKAYGKIC